MKKLLFISSIASVVLLAACSGEYTGDTAANCIYNQFGSVLFEDVKVTGLGDDIEYKFIFDDKGVRTLCKVRPVQGCNLSCVPPVK